MAKMKPSKAKTRKDWCQLTCPYLKQFVHPFYRHMAWCEYMLKNLLWYDGCWTCECKYGEPDPQILKVVETGYKGNENYVKL